ncbi:hypothetical protein JCM33374_g2205 [Metschnikowia sp. JCM 33374]|nr:hypothetical protein JCM33374_g2205 [Metschnikowia sp. JCM 33374]
MFQSWADAEDDIPTPEVTNNSDGTKTVVSYRLNANGQKVKITQKIKEVKVKERVHPSIAIRRGWSKYGKEKHTPAGPDTRTTQLGEKVELKLAASWKEMEKKEEEEKAEEKANLVSTQRLKCRTCGGDHFTAKCPFKETLGAETVGASATPEPTESSKYVPAHLRKDAPSKESRDDSFTLITRRDTGESKGFAYVTFATESHAQKALDELNGKGYHSLILKLEWSQKKKKQHQNQLATLKVTIEELKTTNEVATLQLDSHNQKIGQSAPSASSAMVEVNLLINASVFIFYKEFEHIPIRLSHQSLDDRGRRSDFCDGYSNFRPRYWNTCPKKKKRPAHRIANLGWVDFLLDESQKFMKNLNWPFTLNEQLYLKERCKVVNRTRVFRDPSEIQVLSDGEVKAYLDDPVRVRAVPTSVATTESEVKELGVDAFFIKS